MIDFLVYIFLNVTTIQFLEIVLTKYKLMVYCRYRIKWKKNNSFYQNMPMKFQITHSRDTRAHIFVDKYCKSEYDNVYTALQVFR